MFLKSLTLKGFKSFAESTELTMEPGVTVVVGPNGSGKSNVVDAIAWVLGAQAPSAVRSQKMDDVIFAGTAKRPALGRAEVALTIDNSSGLLPIDFEEVTITRTLFRDGDSEYSINGVPCRLLDVQELLSDSGVGRQQHVIVSQGQIDAVLNARPEERRAIIEEAAGVLKFRRRREKAERRLKATEENLTRVQDMLREVRRQLRPLERQADAARRHGDLVTELGTLQIHLAGREVDSLRGRLGLTRDQRRELATRDTAVKSELADLDQAISTAEARLSATGADDIGDSLARVEGLRERARGLQALLTERIGGLSRQLEASVDQGVIETLEAEVVRLDTELVNVDTLLVGLRPDADRIEEAEAEIAEQRTLFETERSDAVEVGPSEAAEIRGQLASVSEAVRKLETSATHLGARIPQLGDSQERLAGQCEALDQQLVALESRIEGTETTIAASQRELDAGSGALEKAEEEVHQADAERRAWSARADALSMALEQARAAAGVEQLAGVDGVLGTLLDLVDIDEGWEQAFEAAAGPALASVVVEDIDAARAALAHLRRGDIAGGILSLRAGHSSQRPTGEAMLRRHVRATSERVGILLDELLGDVQVVDDFTAAMDAALADQRATFVTREGARFAPDGWRVGVSGTGATGAALDEALNRAEHAIAVLDQRRSALGELKQTQQRTVSTHRDNESTRKALGAQRDAARESRARVGSDLRATRVERDAIETQLAELTTQLTAERGTELQLLASLPALEADEQQALDRARSLEAARESLHSRATQIGVQRTDLEVRIAAAAERKQFLEHRLAELETRLASYADQRSEASARREHLEKRLALAGLLRGVVERRGVQVQTEFDDLRQQRQAQSDAARAAATRLDELRTSRSEAERNLAQLRERSHRLEIEEAEVNLRLEAVIEALRRDLDCEPGRAVETACPPLEGITAKARVRELERELRIMGPINPLALEEFTALSERHQFLQDQLDDVKGSRRDLHKVIRAVDEEIVSVFSSAFVDVAANFEHLFAALFPGGTGRLRLTTPDDMLNTGIEIEAKPSGKNVKKLSLLSGGERSLTALGFLFAVFRSRPSPFYVMDEVEAALDDVNLHRFLQLVAEFRDDAQLIIVSHQKRTMEAADCLYGITMQPGGSSRAISEKPGAEIDLTAPDHQAKSPVSAGVRS